MNNSLSSAFAVCARRFCLLLSIISILFGGLSVRAQVVTFPDPNLESGVRDTLQIYAPTNIYVTNMLTLTNLYVGYRGIQNLNGLQSATNLTLLDLVGNQVTNLSALTGTVHLADLRLANNQLTSLAGLNAASSLQLLDAQNNSLTNLSGLSGMTNLLRVWAGGNPLTNLTGVGSAINLTNLDVAFCQLTNISAVTSLWHMVQFQAEWNHFTDASPLTGLTNMVYLDIGGNRGTGDISITNVSFLAGMKQLKWLSLYYLRINDLAPLTGRSTLTNLEASYNSAPANPAVLNGLTNLILLHLSYDSISNLTFVAHMPQLKDLDVGGNYITDLSPALGHSLTSLMVYYTQLTNTALVANFPALTRLSVGGLGLSNVSFVSGLTNLVELWFDGNPAVSSVAPALGLFNLQHLDVNGTGVTNLPTIAVLSNLNNLEMNNIVPAPNISFVSQLTNLNSLDIGSDHVGDLTPVSSLVQLGNLYAYDNALTDITPLLALGSIDYYWYVDLRNNILDLNPNSAAWNVITNLQQNSFVNIDYLPQSPATGITIWDSPLDQCVTNGASTYFAVSASTTNGILNYQWQFNGSDLSGQTGQVLFLSNVHSNQAGSYRAVLTDDSGRTASTAAHLYVGDPNCGQTVFILRQPLNAVAAPGEDASFTVNAYTTLTNLYYQWQHNGTNILGATSSEFDLSGVDANANGFYQVLVWDDRSNAVASVQAELRVVDVVTFGDLSFSNLVHQALIDQGYTPPGAQLHLTDLDHLGYLSFYNQGISNITGLEYARELFSLDLGGDPIIDPSPIGWLNNLNYLYMDNCGLQDASFVSLLYNLNWLSLNGNMIHTIPVVAGLTNLNGLQLGYNGCLINIPRLAVLTNLSNLSLHSDCLPDIGFCTGMAFLQSLDVGGDGQYDSYRNLIQDISPLAGKSQINWLSLSWDEVTNVPLVATFTNLEHLFLSSNHFQNVTFLTNLPLLQEFTINWSGVTNISPVAAHTPLYNLDVSYILTSNLTAVAGLTNLSTLWCGGNHASGGGNYLTLLTNLYVLGAEMNGITNVGFMTNMPHLYYLGLEFNSITTVAPLTQRTNLQYLYLAGNQIHDVSPLSGLTNTYYLSMYSNGLTNVAPLAGMYSLQWLTLQSNHVQNVSALASLTNLIWSLDLSVNELSDISPLTNLHKLTWLGLWQNQLTSLPSLVGLSNVTSLDFWGNQLTNVSGISGMTSLNWLGLSRNNMKVLSPLSNLPNLRTLDLYTNKLTDASSAASLTGLTWLNMNDNNLQTISPYVGLTNLIYLGVLYNNLNINPGSPVLTDIATMQSHGTYVDYIPQKFLFLTLPLRLGPSQFQFTIQGTAGTTLQIWASTNLTTWSSLGFLTNTNGTATFTDFSATNKVKSYRAQQF